MQSAVDGYNVCVFSYGQTGSGKTFTMEGGVLNSEESGVIPRAVQQIFQVTEMMSRYGWEYKVAVTFQEIYMEQVRDLLTNTICRDQDNLLQILVNSPKEVFPLIDKAREHRKTAETLCNEFSSRSHSIF